MEGLDTALARAVALTRSAGDIAMRHFQVEHRRWEKTPGAIVTEADVAIDGFLSERLPETGDAWLSEESPDDLTRVAARRVWIVDPIDGTRSFASGKPEFCVSVALWEDGNVVLGVVLNPATDDLFTVAGADARHNWRPTALRPWSTGGPTVLLVSGREARAAGFERIFPDAAIAKLGSIAFRIAMIAAGRADGLVTFREIADWDLAAAVRIAEVAGAVVSDRRGDPLRFNQRRPLHEGLIVASPPLHRRLLAHLEGMR